jgi:small subunit ribosomal protein S20
LNVPNVKSAKKRVKTNEKRRQRNRTAKSALKTHLKRIETLDETKDTEAVKQAARQTLSLIGKTRSKGIVNRRKAARLQSRVQRKINQALEAGAAPAGESGETGESGATSESGE